MHLGPPRLTDVPTASWRVGYLFLHICVYVYSYVFFWRQRLPWRKANDTGGGTNSPPLRVDEVISHN